jgi:hypothetical protein
MHVAKHESSSSHLAETSSSDAYVASPRKQFNVLCRKMRVAHFSTQHIKSGASL